MGWGEHFDINVAKKKNENKINKNNVGERREMCNGNIMKDLIILVSAVN
jgi:hypothetical protein